jgi:molecular chaperone DnaK
MTGYGNADHPFQEIRRLLCDTDRRRFAIVLADGVWARQDKAIAAAQMCHEDGIEVAAIGFGGADRNFLEAISSDDANALFVDGTDKLSGAFGTIAQSLGKASSIDEQDARATDIDAW